jgi:hypothetical protein
MIAIVAVLRRLVRRVREAWQHRGFRGLVFLVVLTLATGTVVFSLVEGVEPAERVLLQRHNAYHGGLWQLLSHHGGWQDLHRLLHLRGGGDHPYLHRHDGGDLTRAAWHTS